MTRSEESMAGIALALIVVAFFVGLLLWCLLRGMASNACLEQKYEHDLCYADHWRSKHCYQEFLEEQEHDCE